MGGGTYDFDSRSARTKSYTRRSTQEIFKQRSINNAMSPYNVKIRESRDSVEHPNSQAIIIALDETGSMGSVPDFLVRKGLPNIMKGLIEKGIKDPQVLFLGIGDHECDKAPLQVGQFESSDKLLDKWLTTVYLEGCGGSNGGESYMLAWYFAAMHTSIDCFEKRGQKGYLFTIGDEPVLPTLPEKAIKTLMGDGQFQTYSSSELFERAREKYIVKHLHIAETGSGSRQFVIDGWKQLMQDDLIVVKHREDVAQIITDIVNPQKEIAATKEETEGIIL